MPRKVAPIDTIETDEGKTQQQRNIFENYYFMDEKLASPPSYRGMMPPPSADHGSMMRSSGFAHKIRKSFYSRFVVPFTSCAAFGQTLGSFVPILKWLPNYRWREDLLSDLIAGLTIGVMHVPQGIAYALLAGADPISGLYAALIVPLIYMVFGSSRHVAMGPFAVVAMMAGAANERILRSLSHHQQLTATALDDANDPIHQLYASLMGSSPTAPADVAVPHVSASDLSRALTLTVGLFQLLIAVLHLDFWTVYFCDPLVSGFTTGAAVHVLFSQLGEIVGIRRKGRGGGVANTGPGYLFLRAYNLLARLNESNMATVLASSFGIVYLLGAKFFINPWLNDCFFSSAAGKEAEKEVDEGKLSKEGSQKRVQFKLSIPFELIMLVVFSAVSYWFQWTERYGVEIVGSVPRGLPSPSLPRLDLISSCLSDALAITVVSLAVHVSMANMFADRMHYQINPGQEFYATGLSSTLSSFFPVFPTSAGLARTMVNVEAGARTQLSALFGSTLLVAVVLWIGPLFGPLPLCALSTVVVVSLMPMFAKLGTLPAVWSRSKFDCSIWLFSFGATVVVDVVWGLALSLVFALAIVVARMQWARWTTQFSFGPAIEPAAHSSGRDDDEASASSMQRRCVYRFEAPLIFPNVGRFRSGFQRALSKLLTDASQQNQERTNSVTLTAFILDCSAIGQIDVEGAKCMRGCMRRLWQQEPDVYVIVASANNAIKRMLSDEDGAHPQHKPSSTTSPESSVVSGSSTIVVGCECCGCRCWFVAQLSEATDALDKIAAVVRKMRNGVVDADHSNNSGGGDFHAGGAEATRCPSHAPPPSPQTVDDCWEDEEAATVRGNSQQSGAKQSPA